LFSGCGHWIKNQSNDSELLNSYFDFYAEKKKIQEEVRAGMLIVCVLFTVSFAAFVGDAFTSEGDLVLYTSPNVMDFSLTFHPQPTYIGRQKYQVGCSTGDQSVVLLYGDFNVNKYTAVWTNLTSNDRRQTDFSLPLRPNQTEISAARCTSKLLLFWTQGEVQIFAVPTKFNKLYLQR
jgi:hypothetical protein